MASILKVDTIQDQSGNNIINESGDTITIGASGDTITVPTGASLTVPNGGLSGQNYPAFEATMSADQSVTDNVFTKVQFDTETFDTDNMYDNVTNYRFTPTIAGKYIVMSRVDFTATGSLIQDSSLNIYKNGAIYARSLYDYVDNNINQENVFVSAIIDFNGSTDYIEIYGRINTNSATQTFKSTQKRSVFQAYRIGD